jgi:HK97 family phage major capsid protein
MKTFDPAQFKKFSIQMKATGTEIVAEIFLYDQIGTSFWGDGISAKQFAEQFRAATTSKPAPARCVLHINSPGGDVFDASAIFDLVKQSAVPVDVMIDGLAASAAFTIAMAGRKISIGEAGLMMMHNAKGMAFGSAKDMNQTAGVLDKISNQMAEIYAKRCNMSVAEIKTMMDAETWLTAQECVDKGIADELVEAQPNEEDKAAQVGAAFDLSKYQHVPENLKLRVAALALTKVKAQTECACECAQCENGDCASCNNPDCEDKNCTDCPMQSSASAKASRVKTRETVRPARTAKEKPVMSDATATPAALPAGRIAEVEPDNYNEVASQISDLCMEYECGDLLSDLLKRKRSLVDAQLVVSDHVLARLKRQSAAHPAGLAQPTVDNLTPKERNEYSIRRAILAAFGETEQGRLELEVSAELGKSIGRSPQMGGIFVPTRLNVPRPQAASGLDTKTNAAGKYTVATEVRDLIELLRNHTRVIQLGATVLSGLQGNLQFPTQATPGVLYWTGEDPGTDVTQADITFGVRTMTPKTCQSTTAFSRQLLAQSTVDVEALVREDIAKIHALGIDLAAIAGTGNSNQPHGIIGTTGIGSVLAGDGTNGAVPTYATIVDLETSIAAANADEDGMRFLTTPGMRGKLKKVGKLDSTYASIPLWDQWGNAPGIGDLIGYQAFVSNQVPSTLTKGTKSGVCHAIIFGYWPSVVIGEWGVIELVVDPYSSKKQGLIEVTSFQMVDVMLRQPAQMAACLDASLT